MSLVILQGDGYNCERNEFGGDGSWSNVVAQRDWVLGRISGSITGSEKTFEEFLSPTVALVQFSG